jgi:hypothetical protein
VRRSGDDKRQARIGAHPNPQLISLLAQQLCSAFQRTARSEPADNRQKQLNSSARRWRAVVSAQQIKTILQTTALDRPP